MFLRRLIAALASLAALAAGLAGATPGGPPAPPAQTPVTETLWGVTLRDSYRGLERLDPPTLDWIRREGAYARAVLDSIPARAVFARRLAAVHAEFPAVSGYQAAGGRAFFLRRAAGADDFDLVVRDRAGERTLVDVAAIRAADRGAPYAISYFLASPDGARVAVGVSKDGSEDAQLRVYDAATGARVGGSLDRAQFGFLAWSGDAATLFANRLPDRPPDDLARYTDTTIDAWDMRGPPRTVFSHARLAAAGLPPTETPQVLLAPCAPQAALRLQNGADPHIGVWTAAKADVANEAAWRPLVAPADGVTQVALGGDRLYLVSDAGAPDFKVLELPYGAPLSAARVVVAARNDLIVQSIQPASDALYVVARRGLYATLLRVPPGGEAQELRLPFRGQITEAFADACHPGVVVTMEGWNQPLRAFAFDPAGGRFADLDLAPRPQAALPPARVRELHATAADGVRVPLTVLTPARRPPGGPLVLLAYGSYGISLLPSFSPVYGVFLAEGGAYAVCHVRGGGELGDAWRLAGKGPNKPNTWGDLIACSEDLIRRGIVRRGRLFILGGSGGGIAVGRAATERPDLFAGVIDAVPPADMVRLEAMPDGALETQEFGSVATAQGFHDLLAMDTYQHVRDGVRYPPFLINMGLNDPRVVAWQPAKLAARLQTAGPTPVLLRVDLDNGHGVGSTRAQSDALYADYFAFVFWRSGRPGWQPAAAP